MVEITSRPEVWTDQVIPLGGGAYEVYFHMRVIFDGGDPAGEWHYYGTEPGPEHPNAVQHPPTHIPLIFDLLSGTGLFYELSVDAESNALEA